MGSTQRPIPQSGNPQGSAVESGSGDAKTQFKLQEAPQAEGDRVRKEIESMITIPPNFKVGRPSFPPRQQFPGAHPVSMDCKNISLLPKGYTVSAKADGTRYMMLVDKAKCVYLLDRNNKVFKISDLCFPLAGSSSSSAHLYNTLLDGELVSEKGKDKQVFLIYDIMSLRGNNDVGRKPFYSDQTDDDVRYNLIQEQIIAPRSKEMISGRIVPSKEPIGIERKPFLPVTITNITNLLSQECLYKLDGLVFQPIKDAYTGGTCHQILKWKPPSQNTVDFKLKIERMPEGRVGQLFVGSGRSPYATMDVNEHMEKLDGKIIECGYEVNDSNTGDGQWVLLRERTDRNWPNAYKTAQAVFESIRNPVSEECLKDFVKRNFGDDACETNKAAPETTRDNSNVAALKKPIQTPKPAPKNPKASNVEGVDKLTQAPKAEVASVMDSPQANCTEVKGIKKLPGMPKADPESPDLNVPGVGRLLRTPASTSKPDYSNVEGAKRLLQTPKAIPMPKDEEDYQREVGEPKLLSEDEKEKYQQISPDSGCQAIPEEQVIEEKEVAVPVALETKNTSPVKVATRSPVKRVSTEVLEEEADEKTEDDIPAVSLGRQSIKKTPAKSTEAPDEEEKMEEVLASVTSARRNKKTPGKKTLTEAQEAEQAGKTEEEVVASVTPARRSTKKTPAKTTSSEAPEEESEEKTEEVVASATPAGRSIKKTPAKSSHVESATSESQEEEKAEEVIASVTPARRIHKKTPAKKTLSEAPEEEQAEKTDEVVASDTPAPQRTKKTPAKGSVAIAATEEEPEEEVEELIASLTLVRRSNNKTPAKKATPAPAKVEEIGTGPLVRELLKMNLTSNRESKKEATPAPVQPVNGDAEAVEKPSTLARRDAKKSTTPARVKKATPAARNKVEKEEVAEEREESAPEKEESPPAAVVRGGPKAPAKKQPVPTPVVKTIRTNKKTAPVSKKEQLAQEPEHQTSPAPTKTTRNTKKKVSAEEVDEPKPALSSRRDRSSEAAPKVQDEEEKEEEKDVEVEKPAGRGGRKAPAKAAPPVVEEESSEEEEVVVVARPTAKPKQATPALVEPEEKPRREKKSGGVRQPRESSKKVEASPPTDQPAAKRSRATKGKTVKQEAPSRQTTRSKRN